MARGIREVAKMSSINLAFWQGIVSALCLQPPPPPPMRFRFRGYDILKVDAREALRRDWEALGRDFAQAERKLTNYGDQPQGLIHEEALSR